MPGTDIYCLSNRHLLLTDMEAGSLRLGCQYGWVLDKGSLPGLQMAIFLLCLHMTERETERERKRECKISDLYLYSMVPIIRTPPSWLHLNLITSQTSNLQVPAFWRLGHQRMNLGSTQNYVYNIFLPSFSIIQKPHISTTSTSTKETSGLSPRFCAILIVALLYLLRSQDI